MGQRVTLDGTVVPLFSLWSCRECPDDDRMAPLYAAFPERSPILGGDPGGSTSRPWWVEGEFLNPWSCTNDADCARGVRQNAADFLVVETDQPAEEAPDPKVSAWLLVDNRHGIWVNNLGKVHHRLADTAIEWAAAAIRGDEGTPRPSRAGPGAWRAPTPGGKPRSALEECWRVGVRRRSYLRLSRPARPPSSMPTGGSWG